MPRKKGESQRLLHTCNSDVNTLNIHTMLHFTRHFRHIYKGKLKTSNTIPIIRS